MRGMSAVLRDLPMRPFSEDGAKIAVVIYHPNSMDEPKGKVMELSERQLAANSNRSLMDQVTSHLEHSLLDILSSWRGA